MLTENPMVPEAAVVPGGPPTATSAPGSAPAAEPRQLRCSRGAWEAVRTSPRRLLPSLLRVSLLRELCRQLVRRQGAASGGLCGGPSEPVGSFRKRELCARPGTSPVCEPWASWEARAPWPGFAAVFPLGSPGAF